MAIFILRNITGLKFTLCEINRDTPTILLIDISTVHLFFYPFTVKLSVFIFEVGLTGVLRRGIFINQKISVIFMIPRLVIFSGLLP